MTNRRARFAVWFLSALLRLHAWCEARCLAYGWIVAPAMVPTAVHDERPIVVPTPDPVTIKTLSPKALAPVEEPDRHVLSRRPTVPSPVEHVVMEWCTVARAGITQDFRRQVSLPTPMFQKFGSRMLILEVSESDSVGVPPGRYDHVDEAGGRWVYRRHTPMEAR
jgi:hypothetical protein